MTNSPYREFYQEHVTPENVWEKVECLHPNNHAQEFFPSEDRYNWLMVKLNDLDHDEFHHRYWGFIDSLPVYVERVGWLMATTFDICWLKGKPQ